MKRTDIEVGRVYGLHVKSLTMPVKVEAIRAVQYRSLRSRTTMRFHFDCTRVGGSGTLLTVRSAQKFRYEMVLVDGKLMRLPTF